MRAKTTTADTLRIERDLASSGELTEWRKSFHDRIDLAHRGRAVRALSGIGTVELMAWTASDLDRFGRDTSNFGKTTKDAVRRALLADVADERIDLRVTSAIKSRWEVAAKSRGMSMTDLIRVATDAYVADDSPCSGPTT